MSLNEAVDQELQDETDFITQPELESGQQMGKIIIDATGENGTSDEDEIEVVVKHLEDYQVEIDAVSDKQHRLHDLKEVSNLVLASETISQSVVNQLNHHIQKTVDLEEPPLNPSQVTETPTRTGLMDVRTYIRNLFVDASDSTKELLDRSVETELPHLEKLYVELVDAVIPELLIMYDDLAYVGQDLQSKISMSKNFYVYQVNEKNEPNKELSDLRLMNLGYPIKAVYDPAGQYQDLQGLSAFQAVFQERTLKTALRRICATCKTEPRLSIQMSYLENHEETRMFQFNDLMQLITSRVVYHYLESQFQTLKETNTCVRTRLDALKTWDTTDDTRMAEAITELSCVVNDLVTLYRVSTLLRQMASAAQGYFAVYKKILHIA